MIEEERGEGVAVGVVVVAAAVATAVQVGVRPAVLFSLTSIAPMSLAPPHPAPTPLLPSDIIIIKLCVCHTKCTGFTVFSVCDIDIV